MQRSVCVCVCAHLNVYVCGCAFAWAIPPVAPWKWTSQEDGETHPGNLIARARKSRGNRPFLKDISCCLIRSSPPQCGIRQEFWDPGGISSQTLRAHTAAVYPTCRHVSVSNWPHTQRSAKTIPSNELCCTIVLLVPCVIDCFISFSNCLRPGLSNSFNGGPSVCWFLGFPFN